MITPIRALTINQIIARQDDLLVSADDVKAIAENERAKVIEIIHSFFAEELDKLETDYDGIDEYYKDTKKANELLSLNKRLCERIKDRNES